MLIKIILKLLCSFRRKHVVFISYDMGGGEWKHLSDVDCQVYEMLPLLTQVIEALSPEAQIHFLRVLRERHDVREGVVTICDSHDVGCGEYVVCEDGVHRGHMKLGHMDGLTVGMKFNLRDKDE